ncbi:MAG: hypothetical protein JWQ70_2478 [Aeromicrobium sp.]|nr:hypothetical protein [Aeromicrobium sp.]
MLAALLELVSDLWSSDPESQLARDTRKRANRAYAAAWTLRGRGGSADQALLLRELQSRNVPGSFSATVDDDPTLSFYVESWRAGKDPKLVRAESAAPKR